ncbi:MAG: hypothetical protein JWL90_3700 [Chthoniobacteraceae bacterium]|nr:hypothetical protein [Chthoniobacteraceae bacterium]
MGNRLHDTTHAREARLRKAMIRPEDALEAVSELPAPGEALHALIPGDFIFCDLFPAAAAGPDRCRHALFVGRQHRHAKKLVSLDVRFHLLFSHFLRSLKARIWRAVQEILEPLPSVRLWIARTHCKVAALEFASENSAA